MENAVCKIYYERFENNKIEKGEGSGFFCHFKNNNFQFKYCLFTNNHVLKDSNLEKGQIINLSYLKENKMIEKLIKLTEKRKVIVN